MTHACIHLCVHKNTSTASRMVRSDLGGYRGPQAVHSLPNLDTKGETPSPKINLKNRISFSQNFIAPACSDFGCTKAASAAEEAARVSCVCALELFVCGAWRRSFCPNPLVLGAGNCAERMRLTKIHQLPQWIALHGTKKEPFSFLFFLQLEGKIKKHHSWSFSSP